MGESNLQPVNVAGSERVQAKIHSNPTVEAYHQARAISEEIQKLAEKGAIQEVSDDKEGFYSRLFQL